MSHATPAPAVARELTACLTAILGERLVAVYLGGSFSMVDFEPESSHYDVLVITDGQLRETDLPALAGLHAWLQYEDPEARRLEGDYAPRQLLTPRGASAPVPGFCGGRFLARVAQIMLSADNIANMRASGIVLHGPPAASVLPLVTAEEVRAAVREILDEGPGVCATEAEAAPALLNLLRSLRALESGRPATKSEGAAWARARLDSHW